MHNEVTYMNLKNMLVLDKKKMPISEVNVWNVQNLFMVVKIRFCCAEKKTFYG